MAQQTEHVVKHAACCVSIIFPMKRLGGCSAESQFLLSGLRMSFKHTEGAGNQEPEDEQSGKSLLQLKHTCSYLNVSLCCLN